MEMNGVFALISIRYKEVMIRKGKYECINYEQTHKMKPVCK